MAEIKLNVLNPKGELASPGVEGLKNPRVSSLDGKRIALLSEKPDSVLFFNAMERLLKKAYVIIDVVMIILLAIFPQISLCLLK